ncbi:hypothetical protein Tco_0659716 [Tanacetum coccineum]
MSTAFFSTSIVQDFQDNPDDEEDTRNSQEYMNDLEEEYQARAFLAKSKRFFKKDEEEVSSNDNEVPEVKALMALANEERVSVSKESARNGEWIKISMKKHINTEILKENQNLRNELKELTSITEAWLNSSNKVNQCISEQIPTQKKKILRIDQLTKDTSSSGPKDPVFVKSSADNSEVSITGSNKSKLFEAEDSTLSNHVRLKVESFKASKTESSSALRSKTPTKRYVKDLLRKYDKIGSSVNTPIMPPNMLGPNLNGKAVNESQYRGMIGSLMNLTASRPDIQFSTNLYILKALLFYFVFLHQYMTPSSLLTYRKKKLISEFAEASGSFFLDLIKSLSLEYEHVAMNLTLLEQGSMLLMALPNEHLMTFNQHKDAQTLFATIQTRFGGLQKVWKSSGLSWNKPDLDTMSFDDLYNNFKIVEQEKKWILSGILALLSKRTRRFFPAKLVERSLSIGVTPHGFMTILRGRVFQLPHKMGHFARECRGPRNQDSRNKNQDSSRRTINMEETSSKAMVAIDGAGFDWSYMADDEVPTNMALMAFSDSEVHNDKTCSKTCLKSFETLKTQLDDLRIEFNKSEFNLATYKRGLAYVEEQLFFYKNNEVIFCEQLVVLKRDISYKDSEISMLKSELEKLKQEKESNQLKIENFKNASKSLDKLIGSQITDKSRKGVGFLEFEGYEPKTSKSVSEDICNEVREIPDAPLVKELVLDDNLEKKTISPTFAKIEFVRPKQQEKQVRK